MENSQIINPQSQLKSYRDACPVIVHCWCFRQVLMHKNKRAGIYCKSMSFLICSILRLLTLHTDMVWYRRHMHLFDHQQKVTWVTVGVTCSSPVSRWDTSQLTLTSSTPSSMWRSSWRTQTHDVMVIRGPTLLISFTSRNK